MDIVTIVSRLEKILSLSCELSAMAAMEASVEDIGAVADILAEYVANTLSIGTGMLPSADLIA